MKYSFFEIYNEKIYDLLGKDSTKKLHLREGNKDRVYVDGLECKEAKSIAEIMEDLNRSINKRHSNQTTMNQNSSRSHFIVSFEVESVQIMDFDD